MSRAYTVNQYHSTAAYRRPRAHTVRIRKAVQKRSRIRFFVIAVICVIAGVLMGMFLSPAQVSEASVSYDVKTRYTSVRVEEGMTLHALAREYNTEHLLSNREYVREVQELNHVYDNKIQSGCYLTIPYYESEQPETF